MTIHWIWWSSGLRRGAIVCQALLQDDNGETSRLGDAELLWLHSPDEHKAGVALMADVG